MEDRRPLSACWPLPSYSVSWDLNSGQQAWQQVLLLAESSDQPSSWYLIHKHTVVEPSRMWNFLLPSHIEDDAVAFSYRFSFCLHKHTKISLVSTSCWLNKRALQRNERGQLGLSKSFLVKLWNEFIWSLLAFFFPGRAVLVSEVNSIGCVPCNHFLLYLIKGTV